MSKVDEIDKMINDELADAAEVLEAENSEETAAKSVEGDEAHDESAVDDDSSGEASLEDNTEEKDDLDIEWIECKEADKTKKKKKGMSPKVYNIIRSIAMVIALVTFGYASYELTLIYVESKESTESVNQTKEMFLVDLDDLMNDYELPTNENGETISLENISDGKLFIYNHEKMLEYNSDAKGYIRQDNGEYIDNPILQYTDNDYYLTHLPDHTPSRVGSIYIDYLIKDGLEAKNCILHGHNMGERVGRIMFGSLNWYYHKTGWYKEHPTFDIWVENRRYRYYVFSIYKTDAVGSPIYQFGFDSDEEFLEYAAMCKSLSKYQFKEAPEITADSKLLTMSTCTHADEYRMIVQCVRGEELDIYGNVIKTKEEVEAEAAAKDAAKEEESSSEEQPSEAPSESASEDTNKDNPPTNVEETTTPEATTKAPEPTTKAPEPTTQTPTTQAPTTQAPTTQAPTTQAPTTQAPTTQAPTTQAPTTQAPTTQAPSTEEPTSPQEPTSVQTESSGGAAEPSASESASGEGQSGDSAEEMTTPPAAAE
ncbi:MAG: class B sortase [Lachnospiraceae bacterium]|nr:class B sortase [Lachnospiraceae bacterium]